MKRILLKQMRNEWRENLWLVVALAIVSLAIWVLALQTWREIGAVTLPLGFDPEDVYTLKVEYLPGESPEYTDYGDDHEAMEREDRLELMRHIRASANVEAAAWSNNSIPYNFSFYGNNLYFADNLSDTVFYNANFRNASPDIVKVLRLESRTGKTGAQLTEALSRGEILISNSYNDEYSVRPEEMLGQSVREYSDSVRRYRVADIIEHIRRSDYESPWGGTVLKPVDDDNPGDVWDIVLRVKPGKGEDFIREFDSTPAMQQHRNLYLSQLTRLTDKRSAVLKSQNASVRSAVGLMLVFLVVILLGLLGTFWFRVQQRVQEIAIRKVCGATSADVFRRILGEGMLLLTAASVIAGLVFWLVFRFANLESLNVFGKVHEVIVAELLTFLLVAAGMMFSLWWPAGRAMAIEPALAIKDE